MKKRYEEPPMKYNPALRKYVPDLPSINPKNDKEPIEKSGIKILIVLSIIIISVFLLIVLPIMLK